jgi:exodeoxyribonuclease-3
VRIVTWNCRRGSFEAKSSAVNRLTADLLILQECRAPALSAPDVAWFGETGKLGVAITARGGYSVTPLHANVDAPHFLVPVLVRGPQEFVLFIVWTVDAHKYIRGLVKGLRAYAHKLTSDSKAIVIGDFNSNKKWDDQHPIGENHSAMLQQMEASGLISAYHHFTGENHGGETRGTYFHHHDSRKPHHIDYCFLPKSWTHAVTRVTVGQYEEWRPHSDHAPLMIDLDEGVFRSETSHSR